MSFAAPDTDPLLDAWEAVQAARRHVEALRRLVAARKAGAASLATAEWTLHKAIEHANALGLEADDEPQGAS